MILNLKMFALEWIAEDMHNAGGLRVDNILHEVRCNKATVVGQHGVSFDQLD